jgi:hypothetical protein
MRNMHICISCMVSAMEILSLHWGNISVDIQWRGGGHFEHVVIMYSAFSALTSPNHTKREVGTQKKK